MLNAVKMLLEAKAEPQCTSLNRTTPLHIALMYEQLEVAKALVEEGADVHFQDDDGVTPADSSQTEASQKAMNQYKPMVIIDATEAFVLRVIDRIQKESGMPLHTPEKAFANSRFKTLFNWSEFLTFIDRHKFKDKRLAEVRTKDLENDKWRTKYEEEFFNCYTIFEPELKKNPIAKHFITLTINKAFIKKGPNAQEDDDDDDDD
mmetsp:Transcript_49058/g.76523  ORF Transcript_49058/g.76523 Transcript_49058/m.76523 type:complete len:205 (-) Transcript_49058:1426-2040(-)